MKVINYERLDSNSWVYHVYEISSIAITDSPPKNSVVLVPGTLGESIAICMRGYRGWVNFLEPEDLNKILTIPLM